MHPSFGHLIYWIIIIEQVQRAFTKHITGICDLSYSKRLETLKLYSLQRRRERYSIIYVRKIVERFVPNLSDPITCSLSDLYLTYIVLSEKIIIDAIQELSPTSAAEPDGLSSSLLVNYATELAPFLLIMFTHSLSSGVVPPSFKRAAITPVFKSGNRSVPSNYRPISLTSVISKVLESILNY